MSNARGCGTELKLLLIVEQTLKRSMDIIAHTPKRLTDDRTQVHLVVLLLGQSGFESLH